MRPWAMSPLFDVVVHPPKTWDQDAIRAALDAVDQSLGYVDAFIGDRGYGCFELVAIAVPHASLVSDRFDSGNTDDDVHRP